MERALTTEDLYYFQHSKDSAASYEMILLTSRFKKSEVYGAYWLLEELAMKANNRLIIDYRVFSKYLDLAENDVEEMIDYMIEIGLFTAEDDTLRSVKLQRFVNETNEKKGFISDKQSGRGGCRSNAGRKSKINQTKIKQESNEIKQESNEIKNNSCNSFVDYELEEINGNQRKSKINQTEIKQESNEIKQESNENQNGSLISFENFSSGFEKALINFDCENEGGYRGENNKHNNNYNNNNNKNAEIAATLKKIGVSDSAVKLIVNLNPEVRYVVDVIEYFSQEQKQGKIKNLPAVVVKAINNNWQLPAKEIPKVHTRQSGDVRRYNKLWSDVQAVFVRIFNVPLTDRHYEKFRVNVFDYLNSVCPENLNADFFEKCFVKMLNAGFESDKFSSDKLVSQLQRNIKGFEDRA